MSDEALELAPERSIPSEETILPTRARAERLLRDRSIAFHHIEKIHTDSIPYLREENSDHMTAWLDWRPGGRCDVRVESGWPAEPAVTLLIRPDIADIIAPFDTEQATD